MGRRKRSYRSRSRVWDVLLTLVFFAILAVSVSLLDAYDPREFDGAIFVVDGDTVIIEGEKLRLSGIDAPELDQKCARGGKSYSCGRQSRDFLRDMLRGVAVACKSGGFDRYDRWLVECEAAGTDVNAKMVSSGWAVDYGGYGSEEATARRLKRGIWGGSFETPQEYRRANRGESIAAGEGDLAHGAIGFGSWLRWLSKYIIL